MNTAALELRPFFLLMLPPNLCVWDSQSLGRTIRKPFICALWDTLYHQRPRVIGITSPVFRWVNRGQRRQESHLRPWSSACIGPLEVRGNMLGSYHSGFPICPLWILTQGNITMKVACCLFQLDHKYKCLKGGAVAQRWSTCLMCIRLKAESLLLPK